MAIETQPSIAEIEFVVGSVAKTGMYKAAIITVLLLIVILMAIGFISLI